MDPSLFPNPDGGRQKGTHRLCWSGLTSRCGSSLPLRCVALRCVYDDARAPDYGSMNAQLYFSPPDTWELSYSHPSPFVYTPSTYTCACRLHPATLRSHVAFNFLSYVLLITLILQLYYTYSKIINNTTNIPNKNFPYKDFIYNNTLCKALLTKYKSELNNNKVTDFLIE